MRESVSVSSGCAKTMGYDYGMCFYREEKMAYARQKLLLQKLQSEDEERRGVCIQQQQQPTSQLSQSVQRPTFNSSYQSEFINHTQSAAEVIYILFARSSVVGFCCIGYYCIDISL